MSSVVQKPRSGEVRDWLAELRAIVASKQDEKARKAQFVGVAGEIAEAAPELEEAVLEIALEFGGEEFAEWIRRPFEDKRKAQAKPADEVKPAPKPGVKSFRRPLKPKPPAEKVAEMIAARKAKEAAKPKGEAKAEASFILSEAQPSVEPDAGEAPRVEWVTANCADAPVLSRRAPLDNAKLFTKDKLELSAEGRRSGVGTYFYHGDWWQWNGAFYEKAPKQRMVDMACAWMDRARVNTEDGWERFKPTPKDISSLIGLLQSNVGLDDRVAPPRWLDERAEPAPEGLLAFRNCLVDVGTGKTHAHEPWLWLQDGVDFDFDPRARCPRWERFLKELFPCDEEARETIEEQLGYGMTIDNRFEKAAFWKGEPRSGRGTLASIQERLVGRNGHTSLNIHTWHNNENSRMGMIGKRVGIFHDIRLKPPKTYGSVGYDPGGVDPQSQQLLLELISGDLTEMGRKYLEAWKGKPFIKFVLISNKLLNLNDEVLLTRFIVLEFKECFLGREDTELKRTVLPAELPGIANRCLAAYRRLLRRGHFIQPQSGLALLGKAKAAVTPWIAFMEAYWEPDATGEGIAVSLFDMTFRHWCLQVERLDLVSTSNSNIIQQINQIPKWRYLKSYRPGSDPRRYRMKLKAGAEIPKEVLARWQAMEEARCAGSACS